MKDNLSVLLEKIRNGDEGAFGELIAEYTQLIESAVKRFEPSFREADSMFGTDDLRQCASMAIYRAAIRYDFDRSQKITFGLYAKICVNNALISELRKSKSEVRKRTALKDNGNQRDNGDYSASLVNPEEIHGIAGDLLNDLSEYERTIFDYYVSGKKIREIASLIGKDSKSVSNAVFRMKAKIKNHLKFN